MKFYNPFTPHRFFLVALALKGFNGIFEIIGGTWLWNISPEKVQNLVDRLTYEERLEDAGDFGVRILQHLAQTSVSANQSLALFLLFHGAVKFVLVLMLAWRVRFGYAIAIGAFLAFAAVGAQRVSVTHSLIGLGIVLLDGLLVLLALREIQNDSLDRGTAVS